MIVNNVNRFSVYFIYVNSKYENDYHIVTFFVITSVTVVVQNCCI